MKILHILLIEASLSGHHSIYLEKIALTYVNAGHVVTIALPTGVKNNLILRASLMQYDSIKWHDYNQPIKLDGTGFVELVKREFLVRKAFGNIYKTVNTAHAVDYVFLPYMDYCLYALGLIGSPFSNCKYGGICMRPAFHYKRCGVEAQKTRLDFAKKFLFKRLVCQTSLQRVHSIDKLLVEYMHDDNSNCNKVELLFDPVNAPVLWDQNITKSEFGTAAESKVILVYGSIDERKGVNQLLETLAQDENLSNWKVWLIGRQSSGVKFTLASIKYKNLIIKNRVKIVDDFVDLETEQKAFSGCDVVWVAYEKHYGMSSVLVHAGKYGKPVIAYSTGLIGWYVRNCGVGITIVKDNQSVSRALGSLADLSLSTELGNNGRVTFEKNNWDAFSKKFYM